ncbi:putative carboxypeptidase D [Helianthus annuus]|nr:putative carboxypeptidase D [Helianthus annuus]KAJ0746861.1 putative carboxypeptidase D [Helianthus annuus]KAJ0749524.1 putative carboxypeptidase D [Helianthus annuus]KAJ0921798.1 putative carboxypeptidase D [Helianthus annuus]
MSFWNWGFLLFILFSLNSSLTLSDSDPVTEQQLDQVSSLPGQSFNVDFSHYAGYVTVNEESGRALFYWLTQATEDPASKPLVLWLNGGPGCSSIAFGMAEEVGPFHVNKDGKSVYLNPYSWNTVANLLFLDSPVGVGYSYSNTSEDIRSNGDKRTAEDALQFLLNWLERFPEYKGRDFYLTGESYAGHYVPQLSQAIVRYNKANPGSPINIKGYMVGNALTDDYSDHVGLFQFMWAAGLISDQTYKKANELCDKESFIHPSPECERITDIAYDEMGDIDAYSIFTPTCTGNGVTKRLRRKWHRVGHIGQSYDPCTEQHSIAYFNLPEVQNALHAYHFNSSKTWVTCSGVVGMYWQDSPISVLDVYQELISSGLRIWMFSGDTDAVIPTASTRYSIDALNLTTISPWRAWYEDGQVGGWTQKYEGLTFVTVRGAGHEVPLHKPKQALSILKSFLAGTSMAPFEQVIESKTDSASQQVNSF